MRKKKVQNNSVEKKEINSKAGKWRGRKKDILILYVDRNQGLGGGGLENLWNNKRPKINSTLLADNTRGLIKTKQTKSRPVASASPHLITPAHVNVKVMLVEGGDSCNKQKQTKRERERERERERHTHTNTHTNHSHVCLLIWSVAMGGNTGDLNCN